MIAHELIGGFSRAKTTSFEARSESQLEGVAARDRVRFGFTVTDDGRCLIDFIEKQ